MANIYLAHNWAAREYLRNVVVPELEGRGHKVTSRWVTEEVEENDEKAAVMDLEDLEKAGALIFFPHRFGNMSGAGKFVELGYAIRAGKKIILCGHKCYGNDCRYCQSCVFYSLATVRRVESLEEAMELL